jgi:protein involved in polysaccharide export with SLBB domain
MIHSYRIVFALPLVLLFSACNDHASATNPSPPANTTPAASTTAPATQPLIAPGTILHISIFELVTPGLPYVADIPVDDLGNIELVNLGKIHIAGLTLAQARDEIVHQSIQITHRIIGVAPVFPPQGPEVEVSFKTPIPPDSRPATEK